jgi:hypothetical protein
VLFNIYSNPQRTATAPQSALTTNAYASLPGHSTAGARGNTKKIVTLWLGVNYIRTTGVSCAVTTKPTKQKKQCLPIFKK